MRSTVQTPKSRWHDAEEIYGGHETSSTTRRVIVRRGPVKCFSFFASWCCSVLDKLYICKMCLGMTTEIRTNTEIVHTHRRTMYRNRQTLFVGDESIEDV